MIQVVAEISIACQRVKSDSLSIRSLRMSLVIIVTMPEARHVRFSTTRGVANEQNVRGARCDGYCTSTHVVSRHT